jgi:DedD protein
VAGGNGKHGGGDRVLESRHLVGLFLGVVLLCSVFFTLGYVMGRTQYGLPLPVHASASGREVITSLPVKSAPAEQTPAAPNGEWDFYSSDKNTNRLEPTASAPAAAAPASSATKSPRSLDAERPALSLTKPVSANAIELRRFQAPRIPHGAIVVQLAALSKETDALSMADALQLRHFPSFVVTPAGDNLYRVQVGPYADRAAAEHAKDSLDQAGFKPIIKH